MIEASIQYRTIRRAGAFLILSLFAAGAVPLVASPAPPPRPPQEAQEMEEMRETLQVLMVVSMKRALQLTRDQEREVVPKVQQVFDERERYARVRRDAMRDLQQKVAEESLQEKGYREVVNRIDNLERVHRDLEIRLRAEIDRSLNARQQAQMRIFVPHFRRQLQMRIEEARRVRPPHAAPRESSPPIPEEALDPDDEEF